MATLSITIPNEIAVRVNDAVAGIYGYKSTIPNPTPRPAEEETGFDTWTVTVPNPQTKAQFSKQQVINFLKEVVKSHEANLATKTAREASIDKSESEILLT